MDDTDLWVCYHFVTEDYDRKICTGPIIHDEIRAADSFERGLSEIHARGAMKVLRALGGKRPAPRLRLTFEEYKIIAGRLPEVRDAMALEGLLAVHELMQSKGRRY